MRVIAPDSNWCPRAARSAVKQHNPGLRRAAQIHLQTRDAHEFYRRFGFAEIDPATTRARMILRRPAAPA